LFFPTRKEHGLFVDESSISSKSYGNQSFRLAPPDLRSAIISGKATDIVDTGPYLSMAYKDWFGVQDGTFVREEKLHRSFCR
jgi:two-component system chemotaxis sensor kinase CheA